MNKKDKFETMFEVEKTDVDSDFSKKLNRSINKKVYMKSAKIVILFIILAIIGYYSISAILNVSHYNPLKDEEIETSEGTSSSFHKSMAVFMNTFMPGVDYVQVGEDLEEGFSAYTMEGQFTNRFHYLIMGENISKIKIQYSKVKDINNRVIPLANQFYDLEKNKNNVPAYGEKEDILKELAKMPASAQIDISLSLKDRMKVEDFITFKQAYENTTFIYMASNIFDSVIYLGVTPYTSQWGEYSDAFNKKYPSLQEIEEETKIGYEQHYLSSLQFLLDHKKFMMSVFPNIYAHGEPMTLIKEEIDKIKNEGLSFVGLRVYANRDDAIKLIQSEKVMYPMVLDAKFSLYEK